MSGEEHLLKIILKWQAIPGADSYEICHDCDINEETGESGEIHDGQLHGIDSTHTCGGLPCLTQFGVKRGMNKYHLRVIGGGQGPWSTYQAFEVIEPGTNIQPVPAREEL